MPVKHIEYILSPTNGLHPTVWRKAALDTKCHETRDSVLLIIVYTGA